MTLFTLFAVLITVTALLSWLNERFLRLPHAIGVMVAALGLSILLALAGWLGLIPGGWVEGLLEQVDFNAVLLRGMLSFLLFAGALHVDISGLFESKWTILVLSTLGVLVSTAIVGTLFHLVCIGLGFELPLLEALIFGALISPTDPIAVLGILREARVPEGLKVKVVGESLFNDGVGVVVFSILAGLAWGAHRPSWAHAAELFVEEALGGIVVGLALGYAAYRLLRAVDNYTVEILITLSLVAGGYVLAGSLHTSGPIAMVVAGLFVGNHGRIFGMSERTRERLDAFWELIDEILNALLFVMIGFEVLVLKLSPGYLAAGALCVPLVLVARLVSVGLPITVLRLVRSFARRTITVLTWAGLRGGISIALALSLPPSPRRDLILVATYTVVVFSILVQGLSVGRLVTRVRPAGEV